MKMLLLVIIGLIAGGEIVSSQNMVVNTPSGPIQGITEKVNGLTVQEFLGIPYAEPPLGDQRFLKPKPKQPWSQTFQATKFSPACTQYTTSPFPWYDDLPGKSEDCLYLNIYAPGYARKGNNLAVFFWIHGGGWLFGSSRMDAYNASALVSEGNIIVVTFNYRLSVLGFLTSNTPDAPGNIGMYDMLLALQWVNQNIESFGGDKGRITMSGETAGSISVSLFSVSPLTKGLYSRAVMKSGSTVKSLNNQLQSNLNISQEVAKRVGCASDQMTIQSDPATVVGCLRNKNATTIVQALWSVNPVSSVIYWPQYGDDLFPSNTIEEIRNGNLHNVPLLVGTSKDDGSFFITTGDPDTFGFFGEKDTKFNKTFASNIIRSYLTSYNDPDKYIRYYLDSVSDNDYDGIRNQTYTAVGDTFLLCPTVYFAESYTKKNKNVYYYSFLHRPSNSPWASWMGTPHFEEVQFFFGRPIRRPELYKFNEVQLSKNMVSYWSNFAKNGFPSFVWPKYTEERHDLVNLDVYFSSNILGTGPHLDNCNFLRDHFGF